MKKVFGILVGAALIFSGASVAFADGKALYSKCVACHGPAGKSSNPMYPNLAGQHKKYLVKQMKDIASGKRKNSPMLAAMIPAVKGLDASQMEEVAEYLAGQ